jgi:hypothetical protein
MRIRRINKAALASRRNGARSHGPKTEEGKRISSLNALRHGLLARNIVLSNESQAIFDATLQEHLSKMAPADGVERSAIEEMVSASMRLRRLWMIEKTLFQKALDDRTEPTEAERLAAAFRELAQSPELNLLDRYEARLHRIYQRSLHNLLILREFDAVDASAAASDFPIGQTNLFPDNPLST